LTLEEGIEVVEVNLASVTEVNGVLVGTLSFLRGATLLVVEVDGNAVVIAVKTLAGPGRVLVRCM